MRKEASLSIIEDTVNHKFLMVRNQRGINKGFINFPGGKREEGETMEDCVKRETFEETAITIKNPVEVGYIEFPQSEFYVHVFKSTEFSGTVSAREGEVDVFWVDCDKIPYDEMRQADKDFLPEILGGKFVRRQYLFDENWVLQKIVDL